MYLGLAYLISRHDSVWIDSAGWTLGRILATENCMPSSRCINLHVIFLILTVVDCGNLTDPANGSVTNTSGTALGQTATYSCNTGHNLEGNSTRTCQASGEWSGSAPTCQGMLNGGHFDMHI